MEDGAAKHVLDTLAVEVVLDGLMGHARHLLRGQAVPGAQQQQGSPSDLQVHLESWPPL